MAKLLRTFFGPRIPLRDLGKNYVRYAVPTLLLIAAAVLLLISVQKPYWNMTLHAPQYPGGLHVQAYLDRLEGDVAEIDGLNHYIGMRPLNDAAQFEREVSFMAIVAMACLLIAAIFIHSPWALLFTIPAILFPAGFLLDLYFWLNHFGQNLDPTAALSSSIKPFTPPVLGEGKVGQFRTVAGADTGLIMATVSSGLVLVSLYFHRRAYKPLAEARRAERKAQKQAARASKQPQTTSTRQRSPEEVAA